MKGMFVLATIVLSAASPLARADTFHDDLTPASVSSYLSIYQSNDGQYSSSTSASGLAFSKAALTPAGTEYITADVTSKPFATDSLTGDFDLQLNFAQLSLTNTDDFLRLEITFPSYQKYDVELHGGNTAVFATSSFGSPVDPFSRSVSNGSAGSLRLSRVDSTISGYLNDQLIGSFDNSGPLLDIWGIRFSLCNANSSASPNSVLFSSWSITNANVVPEPASFGILAAGIFAATFRRRSRR